MIVMEAIEARHSVRSYQNKPIRTKIITALNDEIAVCNREGDLHIQLVTGEPDAFNGLMAHYGKFSGVQNYIALVGRKCADLDEKLGYYGERIVLLAQTLGLNTCWVALTFQKGAARRNVSVGKGERFVLVISLGYGVTQGIPHKSKPMETLCRADGAMPDWFRAGVRAAMLAPTAVNQQSFRFTLSGDTVQAENLGGFYSKVDLGIVKYHFEAGAGKNLFRFA